MSPPSFSARRYTSTFSVSSVVYARYSSALSLRGIDRRLHAVQDRSTPPCSSRAGIVREVDGEYLRLLLVRQTEQRLYAGRTCSCTCVWSSRILQSELLMIALLDDGRRDDVVHLLRHHDRLAEILADRSCTCSADSQPYSAEERAFQASSHDKHASARPFSRRILLMKASMMMMVTTGNSSRLSLMLNQSRRR